MHLALKRIFAACMLILCSSLSFAENTAQHPAFTSNKNPITIRQGQTFPIVLQSNPTTGFSWKWKNTPADSNLLSLLRHNYIPSKDKKLVGSPGYEVWVFRANKSQDDHPYRVIQVAHIVMDYERPWEKNSRLRKTFVIHIK